jgi:hypothetical protein
MSPFQSAQRLALFCVGMAVVGCGDSAAPSPNAPAPTVPEPVGDAPAIDESACQGAALPRARIRKLTDLQHGRLLADLFPGLMPAAVDTPGAESAAIQDSDDFVVRAELASQYFAAAEDSAGYVSGKLETFLPCVPLPPGPAEQRTCVATYLGSLAPRAFRRPLAAAELDELLALFDTGAQSSLARGVELAVMGILSAADFVYRTELGAPEAVGPEVPLTAFETASQLSFFLLGSGPDAELWQAAESGALLSGEGVTQQVTRLLQLPEVQQRLTDLYQQVLGAHRALTSQRDAVQYPDLNVELRTSMHAEAQQFVQSVLWQGGRFSDLFTSRAGLIDARLAAFYGLPPVASAAPMELPPTRAGILTRGATLVGMPSGSRSVHRGLFIVDEFLCRKIPNPPAELQQEIDDSLLEGLTERELSSVRASKTTCAGCHSHFDSLGLAFEHYDLIGRWLDQRDGRPVDASGTISSSDVQGPFTNAVELSALLGQSVEVAACVSGHITAHAIGHGLSDGELCAVKQLVVPWLRGGGALNELVPLLTRSRLLLRRTREG